MESNQRQTIIVAVVALLVGWAIGLFLFGWQLWPVEFTGAAPQDLLASHQERYLDALAELYALEGNAVRVQEALGGWEQADAVACYLATGAASVEEAAQYQTLAAVLNGEGCATVTPVSPGPMTGGDNGGGTGIGNILLICGLLVFLLILLGAIFMILQRRNQERPSVETVHSGAEAESAETVLMDSEQAVTPIARFQTSYVRGHDTYDDSFSIENAAGDFLGECGVGISDVLGADTPRNVTAFEVWLFDKNDIRTVTKVVMSDHAFFDPAIKAKLAPKGEPVLARPNETIVLETATLIVNAEITEMEYGTGMHEPQSFFERFTVELSAWAKDGDYDEPDVQGRVDEMLDF
ncbi:MAG: hypothetical protein R3300_05690 [Candidatus Promineifilaceae bacterium]|nr:hypothetical protein [Candidatus Promineifilaceae bacterium]